ncbi:MAG: Cof-type HAD-IIB family hydrolase [Alkalibacterium sp.]|uniref:Cof-type HAD-IIB family hydrolase n=1 Tax=Alkalibacterium sp. TaxID=1872447 RepID=UPI0026488AA7|nr:Cof-type HAD-IIB family hydrolase [Alkalibacterium sp.]MDN6296061.1 Cof-type HAD-IIB family hydrolase [Alkalibacterium sp.]
MKPNALVFFDLDGTLLNEESLVDEEVKEALVQLKEKGAIPFIATGRSPLEIQHVLKDTVIDSFLTLNGQYIQYEGKGVYRNTIPKTLVEGLKQMTGENEMALSLYTSDKIRATRNNPTLKKAYNFIHENPPEIDATLGEEEDVLMMLIINEDATLDQPYLDAFPELSFYRNTPYSMDTVIKGHSKATGIDALIEAIDMKDLPLYAFGDGSNDKEMIERVDYGVAMANGIEEVKNVADYITSSNTEGGLIEGLKHYNLID